MTIDQFEQAMAFLEKQIEAHPENNELLNAYLKLIELEYQYRTKDREFRLKDRESLDKLEAERAKSQRGRNDRQ
ncbi:hypothetical protein I6I07_27280 [Achromobacter deleyi]|uniref:Tetratricopeptide repeat protein n=1 Tax=Achromobacter deleyi TaxID=1353891 RepID=A0A7T4B230_9BURK|nr:hypothetical protein [Achromobacter deleyi]QQB34261.1 hypothetical protein I6I07_27280 [Achromobacter deleyi]